MKSVQITEFFLVSIFPHYWIRRDTPYLSVFSPNAGKYGPEKTPYLATFQAVEMTSVSLCYFLVFSLTHYFVFNNLGGDKKSVDWMKLLSFEKFQTFRFQKKHFYWTCWGLTTFLRKDIVTGDFLWILLNFDEHSV